LTSFKQPVLMYNVFALYVSTIGLNEEVIKKKYVISNMRIR